MPLFLIPLFTAHWGTSRGQDKHRETGIISMRAGKAAHFWTVMSGVSLVCLTWHSPPLQYSPTATNQPVTHFRTNLFCLSYLSNCYVVTISSLRLQHDKTLGEVGGVTFWPFARGCWRAPWSRTSWSSWVTSTGTAPGNLSFADVLWGAKENAECSATELLVDPPQSKSTLRISGAPMVRAKWSNLVRGLTPLLE